MKLTIEQQQKVEDNLPLVTYLLKKYSWTGDDFDEYFQVGAYGLCKAVKRFDESRGTMFSTYASKFILGGALQYYRDFKHGAVRPRRIGTTNNFIKPKYLYIDGMYNEKGEPVGYDVIDIYESEEEEILANLTLEELKSNLSDREKKVFDLAYQGKVQTEIAERLNLSQPQISRTKKSLSIKVKECLA